MSSLSIVRSSSPNIEIQQEAESFSETSHAEARIFDVMQRSLPVLTPSLAEPEAPTRRDLLPEFDLVSNGGEMIDLSAPLVPREDAPSPPLNGLLLGQANFEDNLLQVALQKEQEIMERVRLELENLTARHEEQLQTLHAEQEHCETLLAEIENAQQRISLVEQLDRQKQETAKSIQGLSVQLPKAVLKCVEEIIDNHIHPKDDQKEEDPVIQQELDEFNQVADQVKVELTCKDENAQDKTHIASEHLKLNLLLVELDAAITQHATQYHEDLECVKNKERLLQIHAELHQNITRVESEYRNQRAHLESEYTIASEAHERMQRTYEVETERLLEQERESPDDSVHAAEAHDSLQEEEAPLMSSESDSNPNHSSPSSLSLDVTAEDEKEKSEELASSLFQRHSPRLPISRLHSRTPFSGLSSASAAPASTPSSLAELTREDRAALDLIINRKDLVEADRSDMIFKFFTETKKISEAAMQPLYKAVALEDSDPEGFCMFYFARPDCVERMNAFLDHQQKK